MLVPLPLGVNLVWCAFLLFVLFDFGSHCVNAFR
uniref:Uncharacterized protein n=1 Tax=Rhizophora mucronata TaxID=61149 RepID=A0A2P2MZX6_RHIMU